MANRTCEQCKGAMPNRTHRQRNDKDQLVCDSCKGLNMPSWSTSHAALSVIAQSEMRKREHEAIVSVSTTLRRQREGLAVLAHDSGDNAIINHCCFCGSGSVTGGSDGSVECDFCHNNFTVQVQPAHPNMPQTIDGMPTTPPGMPGGEESEVSGPDDPSVEEGEEGVAAQPLDDTDPTMSNGPVQPGQPPSKQPGPPGKADPQTNPGKGTDQSGKKPNPFAKGDGKKDDKGGDGKKKSVPPWLKKKQMRTRVGALISSDDYMAHLALAEAGPARGAVLEAVRLDNMVRESARDTECPQCEGRGEVWTGQYEHDTHAPVTRTCGRCGGDGVLDANAPENFDLREPPHEGSMRPFSVEAGRYSVTLRFVDGATKKVTFSSNASTEATLKEHGDAAAAKQGYSGYTVEGVQSVREAASEGTSAAAISALLRRLGFNNVSQNRNREGIRVSQSAPGMISVRADLDSDREAEEMADAVDTALRTVEGLAVERRGPNSLYVWKASKEAAADGEPNSKGLVRYEINAEDLKAGDYLDIGGKVRAHRDALVRGDNVTVGWRLKGSGAPGVRKHRVGDKVKVWRRA